jgi:hypothetical protein
VGATTLQQLQEHKQELKEKRTQLYQAKVHRATSILPNRRDPKKKYFLRNEFRAYFDKLSAQHAFWEREAKRLQSPWNIQVGLLLERLPIVTPPIPQWEDDFLTMSDYIDGKTVKIFPKELGMADPTDYTVPTMEELYGTRHPYPLRSFHILTYIHVSRYLLFVLSFSSILARRIHTSS